MPSPTVDVPKWAKLTLLLAALYNLCFGVWALAFPRSAFVWAGMEPARYVELWQCIGMIVGVYGIGYAIAAFNPARHWPIVLVGFLGKLFGPIGMIDAVLSERLPAQVLWLNVANDLIWLVPFALILVHARRLGRASLSDAHVRAS